MWQIPKQPGLLLTSRSHQPSLLHLEQGEGAGVVVAHPALLEILSPVQSASKSAPQTEEDGSEQSHSNRCKMWSV